MERCTLIFGNGLGRALDNDYFKLSSGLSYVWNESTDFTDEQKKLVNSAIPDLGINEYPSSEEELDVLQIAIVAADFLRTFETAKTKWLNKESRKLPQAFRRFVHEVAWYFHDSNKKLPIEFNEPLSTFIRNSKSHVAVLNYDNLLYDALSLSKVLDGYNDTLIDGFWKSGFDGKNLDRYNTEEKSWYMHLHGSPLFIENKKLMREEREQFDPTHKSHIVLTHVKHKPIIIESSPILSEYWKRFSTALSESKKIILFGCSGVDTHLNETIARYFSGNDLIVIEKKMDKNNNWTKIFNEKTVLVHRMDNILEFNEWSHL